MCRCSNARAERTPDYSTGIATTSTKSCAVIVVLALLCRTLLTTIPSLSSAEAAQATTTARVKTGESPDAWLG